MSRPLTHSEKVLPVSASTAAAVGSQVSSSEKAEGLGDEQAATGDVRFGWHVMGLCEITNFTALRRHLGCARSNALVADVAIRAADVCASIDVSPAGRCSVELSYFAPSLNEATAVAHRLAIAFAAPFDLDGEWHNLEITNGFVASPSGQLEDVRLLEETESALEEAKASRQVVVRDLSLGAPAFDRLTLTRDLPRAIEQREMFLQYQPKVHVRLQQINSAEALVRWRHPTRGLILPGDFITIAEDAGHISALTLWTLDQVICDRQTIADDGHDLTIFINISGQLLADRHFVDAVCARIGQADTRIGFEITETAVIRDPESAIANLKIFAAAGIQIAIDDYGAGLSSLAYLKQLPASELKIDKLFVQDLTSSNRDPLIVRSTIDLAHALDMEVTAEGVETPAAMALLSVMGCDMVQGYLISRPISIDAFRHFLDEEKVMRWQDAQHGTFKQPASFWKSA